MPNGPCIVCGALNYPLSMGGPNICPSCDCGPPDPREVRKLREAYLQSITQIAVLESIVSHYQNLAAGDKCPYDKGECDAKVVLKEWLAKAIEVVEVVAKYGIEVPHGRNVELATSMILIKKKAQAILPELRKLAD